MKKFKSIRVVMPMLISLLWMLSCVEPFDAKFTIEDSILVVDGNLTDEAGNNYVNLRKSVPSTSSFSYFFDIEDAIVEILVDGTELIRLDHFDSGTYLFPEGFIAEQGRSYELQFTLANGERYSSNKQEIKTVSPIENVYQRFEKEGIERTLDVVSGHKVYLDTSDPVGKGDAYYWTWSLYEFQKYCFTCNGGRYFPDENGGACRGDFELAAENAIYDYECEEDCWEIIHSNKLNAINDAFIDGREIKGRLIAEIPNYTKYGAVMQIKQHSITDQAFKYLKLLIDQNQNSGSLTDTPSTALIGNIRNETNPIESVGGFFVVSSVSSHTYYLDRSDIPDGIRPVGFYEHRLETPEPAGLSTTRPPLAPCNEAPYRTRIKPDLWKF